MPISTATQITINASGTPAGNVFPHFRVLVDGALVGEAAVSSTGKAYSFNANITADQAHLIKIHYNNDGSVNGQDRNLFVSSIKVGNVAMAPTDKGVLYDRFALDNLDVIAGQKSMWWGDR